MEAVSVILAAVCAMLVMRSRPLVGFLCYLGLLCWYSDWQPIVVGGVNFTAPRLVIPFVLFSCLRNPAVVSRFRWVAADGMIVALVIGEMVAGATTTAFDRLIQNRAGALFDNALVYFAARLVVVSKDDYIRFFKGLLAIAAPLAILGMFQSATGLNPWGQFVERGAVDSFVQEWDINSRRHGLFRAYVNFPYPITFGFFFALVAASATGLWRSIPRERRQPIALGLAMAVAGMMSSMSSGPLLAGIAGGFVIAMWRWRRYWKLGVAGVVIMLTAVDIGSNRTWYDVLGWYCTFNSVTAGYRVGLIKEALGGGMTDHWLLGYGLVSPSNINEVLSHWTHTDITNHYIFQLLRFGLVGFLPWLGFVVFATRGLRVAYREAITMPQRWLIWCIAAGLTSAYASMMSACWEGQPYNLLFAIFGLAATAPFMVRMDNAAIIHEVRARGKAAKAAAAAGGGPGVKSGGA